MTTKHLLEKGVQDHHGQTQDTESLFQLFWNVFHVRFIRDPGITCLYPIPNEEWPFAFFDPLNDFEAHHGTETTPRDKFFVADQTLKLIEVVDDILHVRTVFTERGKLAIYGLSQEIKYLYELTAVSVWCVWCCSQVVATVAPAWVEVERYSFCG